MKTILSRCVAAGALALLTLPALAQDVPDLLKAADRFRVPVRNLRIDTQVSVYKTDGAVDKERLYTVFAQADHQSLVLMQSPAEKGQKMLMAGDDFWLVLPGSQRPVRITPMQKLLGDASTADIAALSWSDDYTGSIAGEDKCGEPVRDCVHLSLQAKRKAVSYQRIELWLGKVRHEPVKADLYVQSDKLAKHAEFVLDPAKPDTVAAMLLQDQIANHRQTKVSYLDRKPQTVPEAWLNPMFLVRGIALD